MSKNLQIVARATVENFGICLYTNGDYEAYQMLEISFGNTGICRKTFSVAPIDFAAIINGILYSKNISQFLEAVEDTWISGRIGNMISDIIDEVEAL